MDRRTLLTGGIAVGIVAALGPLPKSVSPVRISTIRAHIRSTFPYLTISDDDVDRFAADYLDAYGDPGAGQWDQVSSVFLLSTDLFVLDGDDRRPLVYRTIAHPYISPCHNPMARFDES